MANFEEVWDWVDGVLAPGLFESDVDETGNIMMYNQLVGAVRLRQQRVTNHSCVLSDNVQRNVEIGTTRLRQSFFFPAQNIYSVPLSDDGSTISLYPHFVD